MSIELKQLQHYLDSGLMFFDDINQESFNAFEFITSEIQEYGFGFKGNLDQLCEDKHLHVVMFPLSALIEPVLEGGKIPIVELLKLKYPNSPTIGRYSEIEVETEGYPHSFYCYYANYSITIRTFEIERLEKWIVDHLYEWHFWLGYQELFETGELIDKRTML